MPHGAAGPPGFVAVQTAAGDRAVRHVGQAIAVVVATDRYIARDALDLIEVDYEPLPVVTDMEAAIASRRAAALRPRAEQYRLHLAHVRRGDPDAAFAEARGRRHASG